MPTYASVDLRGNDFVALALPSIHTYDVPPASANGHGSSLAIASGSDKILPEDSEVNSKNYTYDAVGIRFAVDHDAGWYGCSGVHYYGFRHYDPKTGRWLSPDPLERTRGIPAELLPEGTNLYSYVGNNPLNYWDPTGEFPHIAAAAGIGGLVNGIVSSANGGSFWKGFGVGFGAGAIAAATMNPAVAFAAARGMGIIGQGIVAGSASGAAGSAFGALADELLDCKDGVSLKNIAKSTLVGGTIGAFTGPMGTLGSAQKLASSPGDVAKEILKLHQKIASTSIAITTTAGGSAMSVSTGGGSSAGCQ